MLKIFQFILSILSKKCTDLVKNDLNVFKDS